MRSTALASPVTLLAASHSYPDRNWVTKSVSHLTDEWCWIIAAGRRFERCLPTMKSSSETAHCSLYFMPSAHCKICSHD